MMGAEMNSDVGNSAKLGQEIRLEVGRRDSFMAADHSDEFQDCAATKAPK